MKIRTRLIPLTSKDTISLLATTSQNPSLREVTKWKFSRRAYNRFEQLQMQICFETTRCLRNTYSIFIVFVIVTWAGSTFNCGASLRCWKCACSCNINILATNLFFQFVPIFPEVEWFHSWKVFSLALSNCIFYYLLLLLLFFAACFCVFVSRKSFIFLDMFFMTFNFHLFILLNTLF